MLNTLFTLEQIRTIALAHTKVILEEVGISENDQFFAIKQYELQFAIYHAIKATIDIKQEYY